MKIPRPVNFNVVSQFRLDYLAESLVMSARVGNLHLFIDRFMDSQGEDIKGVMEDTLLRTFWRRLGAL